MVINREILGGSKFGNAFSAPKLGAGRMAKGLMAGRSLPPVPYKLGLQLLLVSLELLSFGLHQAFMRLAPSSPSGVYKEFHAVCHVLSVFNPPVWLAISKNCWFCMVFKNFLVSFVCFVDLVGLVGLISLVGGAKKPQLCTGSTFLSSLSCFFRSDSCPSKLSCRLKG